MKVLWRRCGLFSLSLYTGIVAGEQPLYATKDDLQFSAPISTSKTQANAHKTLSSSSICPSSSSFHQVQSVDCQAKVPIEFQRERLTSVLNSHAVAGVRGRSQNPAVLLDINDLSTGRTNSLAILDGLSIGESDSAKVGERNKSTVLLKVLDDPLRVGLAQSARSTAIEGVGHRLASREVLNRGGASGSGGGVHRDIDHISSRDGHSVEGVGILRVPLVPGGERRNAVLNTEVDTYTSCQLGVKLKSIC